MRSGYAQTGHGNGLDPTGRDRLVSNVLVNWGAHSAFIIGGFLLPRMIDRRLGQELLGVWDFAWSLVSYFQLVRLGINASVSRYVAKYWADGDIPGVNCIASSATCVLGAAGLTVMGLTLAATLLLPQLFGSRLGKNVIEAQWVVFFLGGSLAIQTSFSAFNGVLTGCHRWGLHNINTSGWYVVTVVGMIVALLLGGGLWILAVINFGGEVLSSVRRVILARRVCEGLRLRPSLVRRQTIRQLFVFGGKTLIPSISNMLLNQTSSVLIVAYLEPAALALYSRPRSLILQMNTLVYKMAMTLTPTISSLQSTGNLREIRELTIRSTQYAFYLVLPMVLIFIVFGGPIMQLWMGSRYANGQIPAILALGYLMTFVQLPALQILAGLNAHGRAGLARFLASLCSVGLNVLVLGYLRWGLSGTAVAVTLPLTLVNVVDIPLLVSRRLGLSVKQYFLSAMVKPTLYTLPFAVCLVAARLIFHGKPLVGLAFGGAIGGMILAVVYWRYVLPKSIRAQVTRIVRPG